MRNKKRRILVAAMAAVLVLTLSAGLMLPAAEGNRTGNAYAAANQWNPAVDDSDSGEPIPGQYIVKKKNGDIELVKTNKGIEELKKDGDIVSVEQNRVVTAFDVEADANDISTSGIIDGDVAQMQYGDEMVRAPEAWEMMPEDTATVRVAVIDTGIDATHPELADCAIEGTTEIDMRRTQRTIMDMVPMFRVLLRLTGTMESELTESREKPKSRSFRSKY